MGMKFFSIFPVDQSFGPIIDVRAVFVRGVGLRCRSCMLVSGVPLRRRTFPAVVHNCAIKPARLGSCPRPITVFERKCSARPEMLDFNRPVVDLEAVAL